MNENETISSEEIRKIRLLLGYTNQIAFSKVYGVSHATYQRMESKGVTEPSVNFYAMKYWKMRAIMGAKLELELAANE